LVSRLGVQPICSASPAQVSPCRCRSSLSTAWSWARSQRSRLSGPPVREPHVSDVQSRAGEKLLRCLPDPAQQVERVLTRRLATRTQPGDRAAAEWVIVAFGVKLRGLIPQLGGQVVPAHISLSARIIDRSEERREVERGESIHFGHRRLPSCPLDLLRKSSRAAGARARPQPPRLSHVSHKLVISHRIWDVVTRQATHPNLREWTTEESRDVWRETMDQKIASRIIPTSAIRADRLVSGLYRLTDLLTRPTEKWGTTRDARHRSPC
jgi:hypothetical protein